MKLRRVLALISLLLVTASIFGCASKTQAPNQALKDIGAQEAFDLLQHNRGNEAFVIIDIRTPEGFNEGHIENAVNIDFYSASFKEDLEKLDKDKLYLIYCLSGNRSGKAIITMKELGYKEVYNLSVGIQEWITQGFPVVK
jgi:rhodanese-related sulfurtransferase